MVRLYIAEKMEFLCLMSCACVRFFAGLLGGMLGGLHILGEKRNAAYKTYIVYGGVFNQSLAKDLSQFES